MFIPFVSSDVICFLGFMVCGLISFWVFVGGYDLHGMSAEFWQVGQGGVCWFFLAFTRLLQLVLSSVSVSSLTRYLFLPEMSRFVGDGWKK